jgi:hypothetical protein
MKLWSCATTYVAHDHKWRFEVRPRPRPARRTRDYHFPSTNVRARTLFLCATAIGTRVAPGDMLGVLFDYICSHDAPIEGTGRERNLQTEQQK